MTYWNEVNDSHIPLWDAEQYQSYSRIKHEINQQGYRGDTLAPSEVVYLGTCDVMSSITDSKQRWCELIHSTLHNDQPLIALGTVGSGVASMVRRLYSYIQNYGAPKYLYMTLPRFDSYEYVNKSGECYSVSSRVGTATFCHKSNLVDQEELDVWLAQLAANKALMNIHNMTYILEERFAFIETLCRAHNIELKWSFNPSDASIFILNNNVSAFENISDFMKAAFVGLPLVKDHLFDRTIGIETHKELYSKFQNSDKWDYTELCNTSASNLAWSLSKYGDEPIKMENRY